MGGGFLLGSMESLFILAETKTENMKHIYGLIAPAIIVFSLCGVADLLGFDMHNYKLFILIGICCLVGLVFGSISTAIICAKHFK